MGVTGVSEKLQIPERQLVGLLRGAGLRVTAVRLALLEELSSHPHADVDE
jgi:hypothetical protein